MRILFLTGISRLAGGVFYAVSSLCRALEAFGTSISVFGRNDPFANEDGVSWHPVPVTLYRAIGPLGLSMELRRLLRSEPADICHLHGLWLDDQWAMLQWYKRTGRPMIISPHGMLDPWALRNAA